jgi:hypothetical protein
MKTVQIAVCLAALCLAAGCIDSKTVYSVKKDGSGTVLVEDYMSPQMASMIEGMTGAVAQMVPTNATTPVAQNPFFTAQLEERRQSISTNLTLISQQTVSNATGWKGYRAVFSFKNIGDLRIPAGSVEPDQQENKPAETAYSFRFTPGAVATLQLVPPSKASAAVDAKPMKEESDPMTEQMASAMVGPMLKGARQNIIVEVEGEIVETSAKYKNGQRQVVLMDVPMDKLTGNAVAMKIITAKSPDQKEKLAALKIDGLQMEDPAKTVTIKFR